MRTVIALLALSLAAVAANAGVVIHMATKSLPDGKQSDHTVYYAQGGFLRIDSLDERGHVTSIDLIRDGVIWQMDVQKRTYEKFDKAHVQSQMQVRDEQLNAMLAKLPPEQRAVMEQRMKKLREPRMDVAWSDTGRNERSGSYSCRIWEEKHTGKLRGEYCVVATGNLPGGDELAASLNNAYAAAKDALSGNPLAAKVLQNYASFNAMSGFPVLHREIEGGKPYEEDLMTSIERQSLPADKFAIPKGFTEKQAGDDD